MRRALIIIIFFIGFNITVQLAGSAPGPCEYNGIETIYEIPQGSEYGNEEFIVIANAGVVNNLSQISAEIEEELQKGE